MGRELNYEDLTGSVQFVPKFIGGLSFIIKGNGPYRRDPRQDDVWMEVRMRDAISELRLRRAPESVLDSFRYWGASYRKLSKLLADTGEFSMKKITRVSCDSNTQTARKLLRMAKAIAAGQDYDGAVGTAIERTGKRIHGWKPYWEHPGFISFVHPKYEGIMVNATPWFDNEREISIQIATDDADILGGFDMKFPRPSGVEDADYESSIKGIVDAYFKAMNRAWPKVMKIVEAQ